jgi:hypothetical protein
MENTTRIADLPELKAQSGAQSASFPNPGGNNYIPINIHPNPYGNQGGATNGIIAPAILPPTAQYYEGGAGAKGKGDGEFQRLPSRDIRIDSTEFTQDTEIKANYIPPPRNMKDYLKEYENREEYEDEPQRIVKHKKHKKRVRFTDDLLVQLQMPILIGILYFIFQQGVVNRILMKLTEKFVNLYNEDGSIGLYGNLAKSVLFAAAFFAIVKAETIFV